MTQNLARATRAILIAAIASTSLVAAGSTAGAGSPCAIGNISGDYCYTDNGSEATIVGYARVGPPSPLVIPGELGGFPVTAIGNSALKNAWLSTVSIPDSVITIGAAAFQSSALQSVTFGNSVTTIGDDAFASDPLTAVTFPQTLTSIGGQAFLFTGLTNVTIPGGVSTIGAQAFFGNSLTSVTMEGSEPSVGTSIFGTVSGGNDPLVTFHTGAYYDRSFTGYWNTPDGLYRVQEASTVSFSSGHALTVPAPVRVVTRNQLEAISWGSLPDPGDLTAAGYQFDGWFAAPEGGTKLDFPQVISADTVLYAQWTWLPCLPDTRSGDYCYTEAGGNATITRYVGPGGPVTIPPTLDSFPVTTIGSNAFASKGLTSVTLPDSVTFIDDLAFFDNDISDLTLGASVTTIDPGAFHSNSLTHVTIPASVHNLGDIAFRSNRLTSVTMEGNAPSSIGLDAFGVVGGANDPIVSFPLVATFTHGGPGFWDASGTMYRVAEPVTVTFVNEMGVAPATVHPRAYIGNVDPGDLTADRYRFDGWYSAASGGSRLSFPMRVTGDTTLYAHWVARDVAAPVDSKPGDSITVSGTGFEPGESVAIELHSDPVLLGTLVANGSGAISGTFTIPAGVPAGNHSLVLTGSVTGVSSGGITIGRELAFTGANPAAPALIALALVGAGIMLRRRFS